MRDIEHMDPDITRDGTYLPEVVQLSHVIGL
jgi:hypothetical protein